MTHKLAIHGAAPELNQPLKLFNSLGKEELEAASRVIQSGCLSGFLGSPSDKYYGGIEVRKLENDWCERFNVPFAVSVNSATSGLIAAMGAIGVGPGDEVILPPYTMSATAMAPLFYGGIPKFVDIEDEYFCIDPILVEKSITSKTKAIIAVNLFGHPAQLKKLRELADKYKICLIEDNAQSILANEQGVLTGTIGHLGVFSLNVHKHINVGEGGIVVTHDPELAKRLQLIRNHGENAVNWLEMKDLTNLIGYNFRLSEIHAAIARAQLSKLDRLIERVVNVGDTLSEQLRDLSGLKVPSVRAACSHVYFMWSCCFDSHVVGVTRAQFCQALVAEGVPISQGYVKPLYHLPVFQKKIAIGASGYPFTQTEIDYSQLRCETVEDLHYNRLFQFQPVSWDVSENELKSIISAFYKVYERLTKLQPHSVLLEN